jgi:hypothetical protein
MARRYSREYQASHQPRLYYCEVLVDLLPGKWYRRHYNAHPCCKLPASWECPGTYVVIADGNIIYIGQSMNVAHRLRGHIQSALYSNWWKTRWGRFREVVVAVRRERFNYERMANEARLIARLRPVNNINLSQSFIRKERRDA